MTTTTHTATEPTTTPTTPAADSSTADAATQDPHALSDAQAVALLRRWVEDYPAHPEEHSYLPAVARMFFEAAKNLRDEEKRRTATPDGAAEASMVARKHAYDHALVALDDNDDVPVDYGDVLHIMTVLQRAIAAVDPYVAGDMAGPYPDEYACFVDLANDARTLAELAQAVAAREVRHDRRTETEAAARIDD